MSGPVAGLWEVDRDISAGGWRERGEEEREKTDLERGEVPPEGREID